MTRSIDDAFGALRGVLNQRPSPARWGELAAALLEWSPHEGFDEKLLPYVARALEAWPDALRVAPSSWFEARGAALPALGRRVNAWFATPCSVRGFEGEAFEVMRLLPDGRIVSASVRATSLVPGDLPWVIDDPAMTRGRYTFDGHALTYGVYIGNQREPEWLIEGLGVVVPGGFDLTTYSHATGHRGHGVFEVFTDARPATQG
jgi:hypothetical protein